MGAPELSTLLWRERELLEMLMFKLEEEQLLLTAGKTRWLHFATREVEQVLEKLRMIGLERAISVSELADDWGMESDATLREVIAHAPSGAWADTFTAHLSSLTELAANIGQLRDTNVTFLRAASRSTQETLAHFNPEAGTYGASGTQDTSPAPAHLFDSKA